ncbi:MAG: VF530 family protein [Bacteroidia bacterium]|nr:VF530 family protein [Bacteroidia bacterium]MCF8426516.1 VF530 family protein [Bacteroidia bacterium]MCF8448030.1 VF530 family protein [Bacteroidia bacterium]
MEAQKNNPLHGLTLEFILTDMVNNEGWDFLGEEVNINCFKSNQTIKSSLNFLRKTPWARAKVESLYTYVLRERKRKLNRG